jgi:hypothetical protein
VGRFSGLLVGSGFGLAFVLANAHAPLSDLLGVAFRVLACVCFLGAVLAAARSGRRRPGSSESPGSRLAPAPRYGRGFWWVVIAEVALLIAGIQVLRAAGAPTDANVAWIALVVGLHFIAFAFVWREASIALPGAALLLLGGAGLALAATSAHDWVPLVSGVSSGFVLLAGSLGAAAGRAPGSTA